MITFGNEINSNTKTSFINNKKGEESEILQIKCKRLEKENKRLKSVIEEMMFLSKNIQSSFEKTENLYFTINDSLKKTLKNDDTIEDNISTHEEKYAKIKYLNFNFIENLRIENFCYDIISSKSLNEYNQNHIPSNVRINNKIR